MFLFVIVEFLFFFLGVGGRYINLIYFGNDMIYFMFFDLNENNSCSYSRKWLMN